MADRLAPELEGQTLWLEGRVVGLPENDGAVQRFVLEGATSRRAALPPRLRPGTVKDGRLLVGSPGSWRDGIRQRLREVDAWGQSATLVALVLGDGSGLAAETWRILQDTGTVHLLVISGQHIGLFAALVYALVAGLARYGLWPRQQPWLPWACGLAFTAALAYGLLAGFGIRSAWCCSGACVIATSGSPGRCCWR